MVGVLIVALVQRAGSPKAAASSASVATAKSAPSAEARGTAATASTPAITSAVATSDAVPVEKLEKLPATGRNTGRIVPPPHATAPRIAPVPPRPRPTGTGGGDSFDPESL
jgi:hypothetical protein